MGELEVTWSLLTSPDFGIPSLLSLPGVGGGEGKHFFHLGSPLISCPVLCVWRCSRSWVGHRNKAEVLYVYKSKCHKKLFK